MNLFSLFLGSMVYEYASFFRACASAHFQKATFFEKRKSDFLLAAKLYSSTCTSFYDRIFVRVVKVREHYVQNKIFFTSFLYV